MNTALKHTIIAMATASALAGKAPIDPQMQSMLNAVPMGKGGAAPALASDGICGGMTMSAIKRFQAANQCYADSRIDAGGITPEPAAIALSPFLSDLAETTRPMAEAKGLRGESDRFVYRFVKPG